MRTSYIVIRTPDHAPTGGVPPSTLGELLLQPGTTHEVLTRGALIDLGQQLTAEAAAELRGIDLDLEAADDPRIVTAPAEPRQIARVLHFPAPLAVHIDWTSIHAAARELGAHLEARGGDDGAMTVTLFWAYGPGETGGAR